MGNFSLAQKRIRSLIFVLALVIALFCVRLVQVQAIQAGEYRNRAINEMENTKIFDIELKRSISNLLRRYRIHSISTPFDIDARYCADSRLGA